MLNTLFQGVFDTDLNSVISVTSFLICLTSSLILGLVMAFTYMAVSYTHLDVYKRQTNLYGPVPMG